MAGDTLARQDSTVTGFGGNNFAVVIESPSKKRYNDFNYEKYSSSGRKVNPGKAIKVDREASPLFFMEGEEGEDEGDDSYDEEVEKKARKMAGLLGSLPPRKGGRGKPKKPSRQTSMTEFAGPTRLNRVKKETVDLTGPDENGEEASADRGKDNVAGNRRAFSWMSKPAAGKGTPRSPSVVVESIRLTAKDMRSKKQAKVKDMFNSAPRSSPVTTIDISDNEQMAVKKRKLSSDHKASNAITISSSSSSSASKTDRTPANRTLRADSDRSANNTSKRSNASTKESLQSPTRRKLVRGSELQSPGVEVKERHRDQGELKEYGGIDSKGRRLTQDATPHRKKKKREESFSSKNKAMEELRNRLNKKKNASSTSKRALYDTSSDSSESSAEEVVEKYDPLKMTKKYLDGDDGEFVVPDDDADAPGSGNHEPDSDDDGLPVDDKMGAHKLTNYEHQPSLMNYSKMKDEEVFRYVFHWILFICLDESFDPRTEYFTGPMRHLDRKLDTLRASRLESAGWTAEFRSSLCRPHIHVKSLFFDEDGDHEYGCDACGRKNHRAVCEISFSGNAYYDDTLRDVTKSNRDSRGLSITSENVPFNAGRFCKEKAVFAHMLRHWRRNLREDVEEELTTQGLMKPEVQEIRAKMKKADRTKYVNNVLGSLEGMGIFGSYYLKFRKALARVEKWIAQER